MLKKLKIPNSQAFEFHYLETHLRALGPAHYLFFTERDSRHLVAIPAD